MFIAFLYANSMAFGFKTLFHSLPSIVHLKKARLEFLGQAWFDSCLSQPSHLGSRFSSLTVLKTL